MIVNANRPRRGITLLETLVTVFCTGLVATMTFSAVGQARLAQARSRDRATMLAIAQSELDRARLLPPPQRTEGTTARAANEWPRGVSAATALTPRPDGTWSAAVTVSFDSIEGREPVVLATILPAGGPR